MPRPAFRKKLILFASSCLAVLSGCGGSSGSMQAATGTTGDSGGTQTSILGRVSASYIGHATPLAGSTANGMSVVGLAGATFTNVSFVPTRNLADTSIAFQRLNQLWVRSGGSEYQVTSAADGTSGPYSWSQDGRIALTYVEPNAITNQLAIVNADGTGFHRITNLSGGTQDPAWSPNNYKIAFDNQGSIYTVNTDGSGLAYVSPGTFPAWSPDGTKLALVASDGTHNQIYTVPATGGTPTQLTNVFATNCSNPAWSPDGTKIYFSIIAGTSSLIVFADASDAGWAYVSSGTVSDFEPNVSPDGRVLLWARDVSNAFSIYSGTLTGLNAQPIISATENLTYPSWSPFRARRVFVGAGGTIYGSAAGFMASENGDAFAAMLAFGARTPSTATITPQATSGQGAQIYLISADSITALAYTNSYYSPPTAVIPAQNAAEPKALVSFSANTGLVTLVVPIAPRKPGEPVAPRAQGGILTYSGTIPAIFDSRGKNLAPHGASEISIDSKTGELVSFR